MSVGNGPFVIMSRRDLPGQAASGQPGSERGSRHGENNKGGRWVGGFNFTLHPPWQSQRGRQGARESLSPSLPPSVLARLLSGAGPDRQKDRRGLKSRGQRVGIRPAEPKSFPPAVWAEEVSRHRTSSDDTVHPYAPGTAPSRVSDPPRAHVNAAQPARPRRRAPSKNDRW